MLAREARENMEREGKERERGREGKKEEGGGKVKWTSKGQGGWAVLGWCHDSPLRSRQKHAWSNVD